MLRGSSLFYALAITVIMALVSTSLLLAAHFGRLRLLRDEMREAVIRNAKSGLEVLMDNSSQDEYDVPQEVDLFGKGSDSVLLQKKSWGAFEIAIAKAHNMAFEEELIAEVGWQGNSNDRTALVLADLDRPLSIAGNTKLKGDCYLPKSGIQRAYIEGQSYSGDELVYGQIKTSDRFLPTCNDTLIKRLKSLFEFRPNGNDSVMYAQQFQQSDSIINSFSAKPLYIFSEGAIAIQSQKISGQVCIISRKSIRIGKNASIENAMLLAPKIEIDDEVEGNFQAFARDSLSTGEKMRLHYPTVLGVISTSQSPDFTFLSFGEKSRIVGQLFACKTESDFRQHVLISTGKESVVYGEIYSSDLVDHKGTVMGMVTCAKFELKTASAEYENHLLNATIDRGKRSADFVSSALTRKKENKKAIVQFLK